MRDAQRRARRRRRARRGVSARPRGVPRATAPDSARSTRSTASRRAGCRPASSACTRSPAHALAAGPGVNPIGDRALALSSWSPERCVCAEPGVGRMSRRCCSRHPRAVARGACSSRTRRPRRRCPTRPPTDPVRAAEYWLDEYGIADRLDRRRAARACASRSSTPASDAVRSSSRAPSSAARTSPASARPTAARRSARSTRNHGSWVASLAAARGTGPGDRHDRRRTRGRAARGVGRLRRVGDRCRSPSRSPRRSAGRSTTAPTSSTCR